MGFTYPPFAALLFAPMSLLPMRWALVLHTISTITVGCALGVAVVRHLVTRGVMSRRHQTYAAYGIGAGAVLLLGPWQHTVALGQINALLLALVAVDILWTSKRPKFLPQGVLTGIAAGIKLTPLAFLLFFIIKRDFASAVRLVATFASTVALMWVFAPQVSADFWFRAVLNTNRIGAAESFNNLSLRGVVERAHFDGVIEPVLWLTLAGVTVAVGIVVMRKLFNAGDTWAALSANALVMLLISPVSHYHHWVWIAVAIPAFVVSFKHVTGQMGWGSFARSGPGVVAAVTTLGFLSMPENVAALTGSPNPYQSVSAVSEVAVSLGILGPILLLGVWAIPRPDAPPEAAGASRVPLRYGEPT
ncbi:glycosyltransferase family 87 protein [Pseudarthrobacter sp. MDT1-22]